MHFVFSFFTDVRYQLVLNPKIIQNWIAGNNISKRPKWSTDKSRWGLQPNPAHAYNQTQVCLTTKYRWGIQRNLDDTCSQTEIRLSMLEGEIP